MPLLDARDLRKTFGPHRVLDGISLSIDVAERVGVVGSNGSGKSTLGRLLAGIDTPDGGVIALQRGARVAWLEQNPVLDPRRTALEEALAGLVDWTEARHRFEAASREVASGSGRGEAALAQAAADVERHGGWDPGHRAEAALTRLGIGDPGVRTEALSGGERRRVALARVLVAEPDLAVLDEPTNHLDIDAIEWLQRHLAESFRGALLLITHDRALLDGVVGRTLEIEGGRLQAYSGGWEAYLEGKSERLAREERIEANRRNFLRRELEWVRRQPKARTGKSKSRIDRAEAAVVSAPASRAAAVAITADPRRSGKRILELEGLSIDIGGRTLVRGLDLTVAAGERLAVLGPNGCGKTTLLRTILGELAPTAGTARIGATVEIGHLRQGRDDLDPARSVLETISDGGASITLGGRTLDPRSYLERFGLRATHLRHPIGNLSGGERARVALARVLRRSANLLILDEPTNDLDVDTLSALETLLVEFAGTALVVTHDRWFLDRVATGTLVFEGEGRVVRHAGGYTDYRARTAADEREAFAPAPPRAPQAPRERTPKRRAALTYAERLELEQLVDRIDAAEARVSAFEAELADPGLYRGGGAQVARRIEELAAARSAAEQLAARWEELALRQERGERGD